MHSYILKFVLILTSISPTLFGMGDKKKLEQLRRDKKELKILSKTLSTESKKAKPILNKAYQKTGMSLNDMFNMVQQNPELRKILYEEAKKQHPNLSEAELWNILNFGAFILEHPEEVKKDFKTKKKEISQEEKALKKKLKQKKK